MGQFTGTHEVKSLAELNQENWRPCIHSCLCDVICEQTNPLNRSKVCPIGHNFLSCIPQSMFLALPVVWRLIAAWWVSSHFVTQVACMDLLTYIIASRKCPECLPCSWAMCLWGRMYWTLELWLRYQGRMLLALVVCLFISVYHFIGFVSADFFRPEEKRR